MITDREKQFPTMRAAYMRMLEIKKILTAPEPHRNRTGTAPELMVPDGNP